MRGRITAVAGAALLALSLVAATAWTTTEPAGAESRYRISARWVGRGLRLIKIHDAKGPNRIRVLRLSPTSPLSLAMELADDEIPGHEPTSSMAARNGAVAAINGDYTLLPSDPRAGRPVHTFAQDANLITSPLLYGRNFALTADEQTAYFGHPEFAAWLTQSDTSEQWQVDAWNEVPAAKGELSVYTMEGGHNHRPPANACSARLMPTAAPALDDTGLSVSQPFTVTANVCKSSPMARKGGTVVAAPSGTVEGAQIQTGLAVGEAVSLSWTTGWAGVEETIGGNPTLLENGIVTIGSCPKTSYFCRRNPRTAIGIDTRGRILLVTVDGRQKSSVGMSLYELVELFRYLGATSALNLDGGGSTTMWVKGRIVNRYSDPTERPVGSSILVLPSTTATPAPTPAPTETPEPQLQTWSSAKASACSVWRDPASTGGLFDHLARRHPKGFGGPVVQRGLDLFRGETTCSEVFGPSS